MKRRIFSELGGFVVYEPALLARYLDEHGLASGDVLAYFTQTEHGGRGYRRGYRRADIGRPQRLLRFCGYRG